MENNSKPATEEDIYLLQRELDYDRIAIGCILSSLSKRIDLDPVFNEAFEIAQEISGDLTQDEGTIYVGKIIESIKAYANLARNAPIHPDLLEEHQGCDINGHPKDPNHHWNKSPE
jgi:hypothetical protein